MYVNVSSAVSVISKRALSVRFFLGHPVIQNSGISDQTGSKEYSTVQFKVPN